MSLAGRLVQRFRYGNPIVLVSGLPRSGTSMAMKMLDAGGLDLITDEARVADEDNPKGYFEDERVKDLAEMDDKRWLRAARGHVIKVVSSLLQHLPSDNFYKVVFMRRDLREVLASQAKMLGRRGESSETDDDAMLRMYTDHLDKVSFQLRYRSNFETLYLTYSDVLGNPVEEVKKLNDFFGGDLDEGAMIAVVDPDLYRNRAAPENPGK
jgi:hypothetical protein